MSDKYAAKSPFVDVTKPRQRPPSWIAKHAAPKVDVHSLRPAPLPREFTAHLHPSVLLDPSQLPPPVSLPKEPQPGQQHSQPVRVDRSHAPPSPPSATSGQRPSYPVRESSAPLATQLLQQELDRVTHEAQQALGRALGDLATARALVHQTAMNQLVELATTIARRVIAVELSTNPRILRQLVSEGMRALELQDRLTVRIGTAFEDLRETLLRELADQVGHLSVLVDPSLSEFGCVVETEHGWVDESIESRLATLLQELRLETDAS